MSPIRKKFKKWACSCTTSTLPGPPSFGRIINGALHQLLQLIHRYSIQAIHCHTPVGGLLGRLAGKLCRDRDLIVIYTAHGFHFYKGAPLFNRSVYYQVEKILARYTDILIVINQEDYQAAQTFRLKPNGLLYHIPGIGLDLDTFQPFSEQQRESLREKQGIGKDDFFLVSIGELNENKNQKIVLEALAEMKRRQKASETPSIRRLRGWVPSGTHGGMDRGNGTEPKTSPCTAIVPTSQKSSAVRTLPFFPPSERDWGWPVWNR